MEGGVFPKCFAIWALYKTLLLREIHDASLKLEEYIVLTKVISKVARRARVTVSMGIKVDYLNRALREIHEVRET